MIIIALEIVYFIHYILGQTNTNFNCSISAFSSQKRRICSTQCDHNNLSDTHLITYAKTELDSHADSIVAGSNCCIMHYTNRECDVSPYRDDYAPIKMYQLYKLQQLINQNTQSKYIF